MRSVPDPELIYRPPCITVGPAEAAAMENREFDYDVLVRPLEPRMMRVAWRIVREREAAEDALQDALATIWKKRDAVARHPNPQALILKIAVAAACDAVRKNRRRLGHEVTGLPDDRTGDGAPSVTRAAEARALRAEILEAIARLPERQATAVLLRIVEEQSYEDIAAAMGCAEATARVHVLRGKAALAKRLARLRPELAEERGETGKEPVS
jgi:RNA polymerase sigma-70 factor (ECF subfamily)